MANVRGNSFMVLLQLRQSRMVDGVRLFNSLAALTIVVTRYYPPTLLEYTV